jgi:K+/H+ antiporter YhaU regulatory subunit KhtT
LRLIIEQDPNSVQLKAEALDKTLENIDQIINKGLLKKFKFRNIMKKVKELKDLDQQLEKENLTPRLNEI